MKTTWMILWCCVVSALWTATPVAAQVSCANVLANSIAVVSVLEDQGGQILNMNVATVDRGGTSSYTCTLQSGSTYVICAVGDDDRVQDLDLYVFDENGGKVAQDDDTTNIAVVNVTPRWTGTFRCEVRGYSMSRSDAFYCVIVARGD
ncbi:MAG: hypothetical protein Q4D38_14300 [Planctomycetia bacterium]|nr:hypothetical protein [Planctomycetia bacterium]